MLNWKIRLLEISRILNSIFDFLLKIELHEYDGDITFVCKVVNLSILSQKAEANRK